MEITKNELQKTYQELSNDEIEYLVYQETSLTPAAKEALKEEIERRQLSGEWIKIVDEKDGEPPSEDNELEGGAARSPFGLLAPIFEALFPSFNQIAFVVVWFLLCYVAYLVVNYFVFS